MKRLLAINLTASLLAVCALQSVANATIFNLTDRNSTFSVDTQSQAGAFDWIVDGTDNLFQQWFWYRVGNTGPEASLDALNLTFEKASDTDADAGNEVLNVTYTDPQGRFDIHINYTLTGGMSGSKASDVAETITIDNLSTGTLDFHFFQYSDFDLNGTSNGQTASFITPQAFQQFGAGIEFSETVATPPASHHQADFFSTIRDSLNNGTATTLNDNNVAGPGDVTWAFQWDFSIAAGTSMQVSKDKQLHAVPEPVSLAMWSSLGALGLVYRSRRRAV